MSKVSNWQINREMDYPFEGHRPSKQWSIVFDLNKCIACQSCSLACKTTWTSGRGQEYMFWNNVECKPWGGYPLAWDLNILRKIGRQEWQKHDDKSVYAGKTIFEAAEPNEKVAFFFPTDEDWAHPNIGEDDCTGSLEAGAHYEGEHKQWLFYLPRTCAHCTYPACLAACPRQAIYKRDDDGIVLIDQSRCKGYQECVRACPYKKSMFNVETKTSEKCIGCYPAVEQGKQPMCVQNCIGKIRIMGFLNPPEKARMDNPVDFLVHHKKLALPLYPQLGLEPNIYYVPPVHVDTDFLEQMFGPGVEESIAAYRDLPKDPVAAGLLLLIGSTDKILHRFEVTETEAIGYDGDDAECIRVPIREPLVERPAWDAKRKMIRQNTP